MSFVLFIIKCIYSLACLSCGPGNKYYFLQSTLNLSHNVMVRFAPSVELFWCATLKKLHLDYNQLEEMTESMVKLCK